MTHPHGAETILLVEDEASLLDLSKMMLDRMGYIVLSAPTPQDAIEIARSYEDSIQLLVSDVVMPQMNGKELKGRIERIKPGIKALFVSGYDANVIVHHGVLDADVNFLQKPYSINSLSTKVREVLDQ